MLFKLAFLLVFLALPAEFSSSQVTPKVLNGVADFFDVSKAPFVQIGEGYYYFETNLTRNWFDAYETCRRMDAQLIAFETKDEWNFVNQYIWDKKIVDIYWTSGSDLANHGKHEWFSTGKPVDLDSIWFPGEPNNFTGNEHCDELGYRRTEDNYNDLNDNNCSNERRYICEARQPITAAFLIW